MKKIKNYLKRLLGTKTVKFVGDFKNIFIVLLDIMLIPFTIFFAYYFRVMRKRNFKGKPISKKILFSVGVLPVIDHYYEPLFNHKKHLNKSLKDNRNLPGIDFNINSQIKVIKRFNFSDELLKIPLEKKNEKVGFCFMEGPFPPADAEYLYNIIRSYKPKRIIEIGSGHSTLMAANAINQNKFQDKNYNCQHICIEPYENKWLDELGVQIIREKVENCDISLFKKLEENDILFIDSSHIIRPQGDVLFEYLEILPSLQSGVLVHIHDIFTPQDYPEEWVFYGHRLWNEQYLLEAFLTCNNDFTIIGSTNFLLYNHYDDFAKTHPISKLLTENGKQVGAGSFWLKRK